MEESENLVDTGDKEPNIVKFDYIKSNLFRVIHAEGIWGCVTPSFGIQIAFWNERFPIPQQVVYGHTSDGLLEEISEKRVIRDSIIREVEASVVIDLNTAEMIVEWLQERIQEIYQLTEEEVVTGEEVEKEQSNEDTNYELPA